VPITGKHHRTIDAKGRLIVPSHMRDELGTHRVVLVVWPDECVAMWTEEKWEELTQQLLEQPKSNSDARSAARALGASAHTDGIDRQGRITVPQHLRDFAGIDKEVMVVGALDHAELWSLGTWSQREQEETPQDLGELWSRLNF
jgi:MraZ protein